MNPNATGILLAISLIGFLYSAFRRFRLLQVGGRTRSNSGRKIGATFSHLWRRVVLHDRLFRYSWPGVAHQVIFFGFLFLLPRTFELVARGFSCHQTLWHLADLGVVEGAYLCLRGLCEVAVLAGVGIFVFLRVVRPQRRMTLNLEGLAVLAAIAAVILTDLLYDAVGIALATSLGSGCNGAYCESAGTIAAPFENVRYTYLVNVAPTAVLARWFAQTSVGSLVVLGNIGFWAHLTLVLALLNVLPYSKHFHIVTAIANVALANRAGMGIPRLIARDTDSLLALVERATFLDDDLRAPIGVARISHFSWKDLLDLYSCTECGRCSEHCPAAQSGKPLDPKQLLVKLRNHLRQQQPIASELRYERQAVEDWLTPPDPAMPETIAPISRANSVAPVATVREGDLVPEIITPAALWACTTCRACEQECPVEIGHVGKILEMRRNLVLIRGAHFPPELQRMFDGLETNANPWNLPQADRGKWAGGLNLKLLADFPSVPLLLWVGCAASYEPQAQRIARATARLLTLAGVDFAILGDEERCTGDPARRAGNEYLFLQAAERNIATFEHYRQLGGLQRIVTVCPHCYNSLANEYSALGARYEVSHHSQLLLELVESGRLHPRKANLGATVFHDACYLGRYNGVFDAPRRLLASCGEVAVEVPCETKDRGGCCGAGGAHLWLEEHGQQRVSTARAEALLRTGASQIATGCPHCMTMLSPAVTAAGNGSVKTRDIAELLLEACS